MKIDLSDELFFLGDRALDALVWEDYITHKEFAEKYIILTDGVERGSFRVDTAPHTEEVFLDADNPNVKRITLMWASQSAKTTTATILLFKGLVTSYDNAFVMFPTANKLSLLIKFKVAPMLEGCPILKSRIEDYSQEESERKNSYIYNTGRNKFAVLSPANTKSITVRYMMYDECAEMDIDTINEADERAKTYSEIGFKSIRVSTKIHDEDAISYSFLTSEVKKRRFIPCPKCNNLFYPSPDNFKFKTLDEFKRYMGIPENQGVKEYMILSDYIPYASKDPYLECPKCGYKIYDNERKQLILGKKLVWKQVEPFELENGEIDYRIANKIKTEYSSVGYDINTMCIHNVPMAEFVRKEIECQYAKPHLKNGLYEKFYVGYWNKVWKDTEKKEVKKNDILLLTNGVGYRELTEDEYALTKNRRFVGYAHNDTNAIHIGVDLQKDRLYYEVLGVRYSSPDDEVHGMICDIIEYGELFSNGVGNDFKQLRVIMESIFESPDGGRHQVTSVGIDIRGFSLEEADSRSNEAINFIFDYAEMLRDYGVVNWDKFIFPMMGQDKILEQRYEVQGFKTRQRARVKEIDGTKIETKLTDIVFSNKAIKDIVFKIIERGIEKAKASEDEVAYKYDRKLLYITDFALDNFEQRQELPYEKRRDKHSLENHLTSEKLTYKKGKNGKPTNELIYQKIYDGVRNDYLDCLCMAITQSIMLDTYRTPKPKEVEAKEEVISSPIDRLKNSFML